MEKNMNGGIYNSEAGNGKINGYEYVDLGLSVKWATCNVGAFFPSDYGDYYAWGEISTKKEYIGNNSVTYNKAFGDIGGVPQYDVARADWGGSWRLPTESEFRELVEVCRWTWTIIDGVKGYHVVGPNGNAIFLPVAGYRYGASLGSAGAGGYYWSSTPHKSNTDGAYGLNFNSGNPGVDWYSRCGGRSVRPVSE